jgi:hypothetical protein
VFLFDKKRKQKEKKRIKKIVKRKEKNEIAKTEIETIR